ncbi:MAG TPA: TonB-dependent receptor plug domain-containing protein, partial [Chitinophagaceae bacterium]|nr:TonB-dependent receptor plug domain-containing protein [Chitinophagaceae bacterium]
MRKFLLILSSLICCSGFIFAQQVVAGRIIDENNKPLSGATITEKGADHSSLTNSNGLFSITIKKGSHLLITAVEMEPVDTIANGSFLNIRLLPRFANLQNVEVVTAQGIRRRPEEIGYATSVIKNQQLINGRSPTIAQSLSGKVAGLTIYNVNNSVNNDTRIVLRGDRSITGNNEALIVLNEVPVPSDVLNFLNPNDIEDVTVLKGGQAATLYGSDGVNGVLVITTKKSVKNKIEINYSSSYDIDKVSSLPAFQTEFGSGANYGLTPQEDYRPYENQSYGDRFDGNIRAVGRVLEDGSVLELPYSPVKDQKKKVWNTGNVAQNAILLSAGDDKSSFHLSVQNYINKGIVPEDEYKRNNIHFYGAHEFGKLKTSFDGIYSTDRTQRTTAYFYIEILNTPEEIPINALKDWRHDKFANPNGYFNDFVGNPWFDLESQRMDRQNNYFYGNLSLSLQATKWFNIKYRFSTTSFASFSKSWVEPFTYTQWAIKKAYTLDPKYNDYYGIPRAMGGQPGYVQDDGGVSNIINSDLILTFEHHWKNYSASVIFGNNIQSHWTKDLNVSAASIVIPGVYNVSNRQGILVGNENNTLLHKFGNYMDATVGYKDLIFLETSIRYDGSSVFINPNQPNRNNKYFYYGFSGSFVMTKILPELKTDFLNYGQIRLSYNKNINANLYPYALLPTFSDGTGFPFGNLVGITT